MATEGFITIAYGKPEYIRMAKAMVMSCLFYKPKRRIEKRFRRRNRASF
jgi:rRNA processing protein Krr1/Pno1